MKYPLLKRSEMKFRLVCLDGSKYEGDMREGIYESSLIRFQNRYFNYHRLEKDAILVYAEGITCDVDASEVTLAAVGTNPPL